MPFTPKIRAASLLFLLMSAVRLTALPMRPAEPQEPPLPAVDPIPMKEGTLLEKDFAAAERDWGTRLLLQPAQQRWKGQPWAEEATALVEAVLDQFEKDHVDELALAPLAGRFRELLKKTSDDPLLLVFGAQAIFGENEDWRESRPLLEKALAQPGLSGAQEMMAAYVRWLVARTEGLNTDELQMHWLSAMERSLADGSYDEVSHIVLVRHHIKTLDSAKPGRANLLENYSRSVEASSLPEWVKCTLRGKTEKELAWVKRGGDWAGNVNDTQWKGFAEHLKSARDLLGRAARLRPDRPEPAGSMIGVAMGEGMDFKELRAWFDRSVSAQFDYLPAYSSMLWAGRPRWGGSHEFMLAFGKACAETKRYDTAVPSRLMTAALEVTEELYEPRFAFRHPHVRQAIVDMSRGYLEASASQPPLTRHLRQSNAAMCSFLADDDALAQKALNAAGPRLSRNTLKMLNTMFMHEAWLRAEVAADTGAYGEAVRLAANPAPGTPLKEIHAAFMKVDEKGLSPAALSYLREAQEMTGLQQAVQAGDWVNLRFHQHLTAFYQSEDGAWAVDPDGLLVCRGTGFPRSGLVLRIPLGPDVEMKGEICFDIPATTQKSQFGCGFAPQLHWTPVCKDGLRAMIYHLSENSACTKAYCNDVNNCTADIPFPLKEWNSFSIRSADGKFSYDVNGRTMVASRDMAGLGLDAASGFLGFSAYRLPIGTQVRVRNVSIRKITAVALAPVAPISAAQSETFFIDRFPDWTWKASLLGLLVLFAIYIPRFMPKHED